jgi:hypothetical protein
VDGTNLLNETYHEIAGVSMPGRWMTIGLTIRPDIGRRARYSVRNAGSPH